MLTNKFPILTYHSIDESESVISVSDEMFGEQMDFLHKNDFNTVSLKTLAGFLIKRENLPPKTVALTFDDGYENFYTRAFPILQKYNFTATVFLITDYCGKRSDWSGNSTALEQRKLMDWNKIKELNNYRIEFAAHSRTHPDLTKIPIADAERQMAESKSEIESQLGTEAANFAYPYGSFNREIKTLAEKYFRIAVSTNLGKIQIGDDKLQLKRIDAYYLKNSRVFNRVLSGKFDEYLYLRQALRRLRAAWYNIK